MTDPNEKVNGEIVFDQSGIVVGNKGGLTKREYFAGLAMQGMLAANDDTVTDFAKKNGIDYGRAITIMSVSLADDLIAALNKEPSNE